MGFNWRDLDLGKRIILGGAGALLLATLFPPWTVTSRTKGPGELLYEGLEYGFLFDPPSGSHPLVFGEQRYDVVGRTSLNPPILLASARPAPGTPRCSDDFPRRR